MLPTIFLDYKSTVAHDFIVKDKEKRLIYNLVFSKTTCQTITLPAPSLFNIHSSTYLIMPDGIYAYWELTRVLEPKPEPPLDPYWESIYQWDPEELAKQWHPVGPPQYTGEARFDPWA